MSYTTSKISDVSGRLAEYFDADLQTEVVVADPRPMAAPRSISKKKARVAARRRLERRRGYRTLGTAGRGASTLKSMALSHIDEVSEKRLSSGWFGSDVYLSRTAWEFAPSTKRHVLLQGWNVVDTSSDGLDAGCDVTEEFASLLDWWARETRYSSSLHQIFLHPAYLRMIALGREALPLMLEELQRNPVRWFVALRAVARVDPAEGIDDIEAAVRAWIDWARAQGLSVGDP